MSDQIELVNRIGMLAAGVAVIALVFRLFDGTVAYAVAAGPAAVMLWVYVDYRRMKRSLEGGSA